MVDCTVVIPVFNRGEALDAGIASLRAQSLGSDRIEIIYVDDGSNDGRTPAMIDRIVAATPNARVFHEPASGSPGRPRNVGLANARGEFVFFADHDDWFDPQALERLVGWARQHGSDVVIGKVIGHGRRAVIPRLFRESRPRVPAPEAMISLTPHKLFRRDFLSDHQITYPEGRRRLEDHHFVTHAYLHARTISVYADRICYHHNHPGNEGNFSRSVADPVGYSANNREVMELICRHTSDDVALRNALLQRPVLHELLKKASPRRMRQLDPAGEARKHRALRTALVEAVPSEVVDQLEAFPRATAKALRDDDPEAVRRIDAQATALSLKAEIRDARVSGSSWAIGYEVVVQHNDKPVLLHRAGHDTWLIDEALLAAAETDRPEREDRLRAVDLEVVVANRETSAQWHLPTANSVSLRTECRWRLRARRGGDATLVIMGTATLDLAHVGGSQLAGGIWDVLLRADVFGVELRTRLVVPASWEAAELPKTELRDPDATATALRTKSHRTFAVRVEAP
jgi:glycosyltransferase involved in cell wall biosynthesis